MRTRVVCRREYIVTAPMWNIQANKNEKKKKQETNSLLIKEVSPAIFLCTNN